MAELEELREVERYVDETFRDTVVLSHLQSESPSALKEDESRKGTEHSTGAEGNHPVVGTLLPEDVAVSSRTEDTSEGEGMPVRKR